MSEHGWVALQADPADQRRTLVAATPAGRRLVKPLVTRARAHESALLKSLPAAEKAALKKLLVKIASVAS
jgi:DNA-binding MarR family transcriptional regulator